MFGHILRKVQEEVCETAAMDHLKVLTRHHRIPASPGFREAAKYCEGYLSSLGLETKIHEYPADGVTTMWNVVSHEEWSAADASLRIVEPRNKTKTLARFGDNKISLIQRSIPTPSGGVEAEVVALDKGETEEEYSEVDVSGKLVLTSGDVERVRCLAVERHGALGIIYDGMRELTPVRGRMDLPDARQYTSFWWSGEKKRCFGFVLSPRMGQELRDLLKEEKNKGGSVKVHANVQSRLYEGKMEVVSAVAPGIGREEVWVLAHLCHPQPSANDNASGVAATLEAARLLTSLLRDGRLPKPRRSIRFLLLPEWTGTAAFLSSHEETIPNVVGAINLDMVGQNQDLCRSVWVVEMPPDSSPNFSGVLAVRILRRVIPRFTDLTAIAQYPLVRQAVAHFSAASDHGYLNDPSVGIPCSMLIQWPDKFYHTSEDTLDKVDPQSLAVAATVAATYTYFLAHAGLPEAEWLMQETLSQNKRRMITWTQRSINIAYTRALRISHHSEGKEKATDRSLSEMLTRMLSQTKTRLKYRFGVGSQALLSVSRLAPVKYRKRFRRSIEIAGIRDLRRMMDQEIGRMKSAVAQLASERGVQVARSTRRTRRSVLERKAAAMVPERVFRGLPWYKHLERRLGDKETDELWSLQKTHEKSEKSLRGPSIRWVDGRRNLLDVSRLAELETGKADLVYLVKYFELLESMGVLKIRRAA